MPLGPDAVEIWVRSRRIPMNAFPNALKLRALSPAELREMKSDAAQFTLIEDFVFNSSAGVITVPAGFCSDFASVPRAARWYVDDDDPAILFASIIHDAIYAVAGVLPDRTLTRAQCDDILAEAMLACGAGWLQRAVVYRAVRLFGGSHWRKL